MTSVVKSTKSFKNKEKKDCTREAKLYCFVCKKKYCQKCATLLHSKKNFHVKYCTSVEEFKKFGNASIYCSSHKKNFLEYIHKETGELYCSDCEFQLEDCQLIQESRILLNELLSTCQDDFEKKKEQENQILKDLEIYKNEIENLFESLLKLREEKLKEIEELKLNAKKSLNLIDVVSNKMKKEPKDSNVFYLSSIQKKNLEILKEKTVAIDFESPLNVLDSIESKLKIYKMEEKENEESVEQFEEEIEEVQEVSLSEKIVPELKLDQVDDGIHQEERIPQRSFSLFHSPRSKSMMGWIQKKLQ
jgi:hypothetical protein